MPGTFTQLYIQIVFAVKGRQSLVHAAWEDQLYRYISGIVQNKEQKMLAINGMPDHLHFLIGMKPSCCLSDLVREVKKASNEFINQKKFTPDKFISQLNQIKLSRHSTVVALQDALHLNEILYNSGSTHVMQVTRQLKETLVRNIQTDSQDLSQKTKPSTNQPRNSIF